MHCDYTPQLGDDSPDVEAAALAAAFETTQALLRQRKISAGHDISDGGIVVGLLEMAFGGNTGIKVRFCKCRPVGPPFVLTMASRVQAAAVLIHPIMDRLYTCRCSTFPEVPAASGIKRCAGGPAIQRQRAACGAICGGARVAAGSGAAGRG